MNVRNLLMLLLLTLGLGHLSAEDAAAPTKADGAADLSEATSTGDIDPKDMDSLNQIMNEDDKTKSNNDWLSNYNDL